MGKDWFLEHRGGSPEAATCLRADPRLGLGDLQIDFCSPESRDYQKHQKHTEKGETQDLKDTLTPESPGFG